MNNTTKAKDTATAYIHETGFQLCVGFYLHNKGLVAEYKDINVYKGLLISDPEGKLDPVITEPEVPAEPVPTGDAAGIYVLVAAVALLGTAFVAKRREN